MGHQLILWGLLLPVLGLSSVAESRKEEPLWRGPWKGLPELLRLLGSVPEGKAILSQANRKDPDFFKKIRVGDVSFTESTFVRSYSLIDGKERAELHNEVTINQRLTLADAVVDLAHELVHFAEKEMLDPYGSNFSLREFVVQGIEGPGGELQALQRECQVAWSLKSRYPGFPTHWLCAPYQSTSGRFLKEKARQDYYAIGGWGGRLPPEAQKVLPPLSRKPVVFTSSYARLPYPIALAEEFGNTLKVACQNNRRKNKLISAQAENGRSPASEDLMRERHRLRAYERQVCGSAHPDDKDDKR